MKSLSFTFQHGFFSASLFELSQSWLGTRERTKSKKQRLMENCQETEKPTKRSLLATFEKTEQQNYSNKVLYLLADNENKYIILI
jgi:hypothetical protein